jgi:hypothetical protein
MMNKTFLLLLAVVLIASLVVLALPALGQPSTAPAPGGSAAPAQPGPPPGFHRPAGPPGMNGPPAVAKAAPPAPDLAKAAPKVGLIAGIIVLIAIGIVLATKKKQKA